MIKELIKRRKNIFEKTAYKPFSYNKYENDETVFTNNTTQTYKMDISGKCVQNSESPYIVSSVGDLITDTNSEMFGKYEVSVTVHNKNLADIKPYNFFIRNIGIIYNVSTGILTLNGHCTEEFVLGICLKYEIPAGKYVMNFEYLSGNVITENDNDILLQIGFSNMEYNNYYGNCPFVKATKNILYSSDFIEKTSTLPIKYLGLYFKENCVGTVFENYKIRLRLEENELTEGYVIPSENKYSFYLSEPLYSIKDIKDILDLKNGRVIRKIKKISLNNSSVLHSEMQGENALCFLGSENYVLETEGDGNDLHILTEGYLNSDNVGGAVVYNETKNNFHFKLENGNYTEKSAYFSSLPNGKNYDIYYVRKNVSYEYFYKKAVCFYKGKNYVIVSTSTPSNEFSVYTPIKA